MGDFFNQENLCTKVVEKKTVEAGNWNHSLLEKMQNSTVTMKDSLVVSYKTEHTLTI